MSVAQRSSVGISKFIIKYPLKISFKKSCTKVFQLVERSRGREQWAKCEQKASQGRLRWTEASADTLGKTLTARLSPHCTWLRLSHVTHWWVCAWCSSVLPVPKNPDQLFMPRVTVLVGLSTNQHGLKAGGLGNCNRGFASTAWERV